MAAGELIPAAYRTGVSPPSPAQPDGAGLGYELRSRLDHSAVLALVNLNAELGLLEQLLNELSGGNEAAVHGLRDRIRAMQEQLATLAGNVA